MPTYGEIRRLGGLTSSALLHRGVWTRPNNLHHKARPAACIHVQWVSVLGPSAVTEWGPAADLLSAGTRLPPTGASPLCWQPVLTVHADSYGNFICLGTGVLFCHPITWVTTASHQTIIKSSHHLTLLDTFSHQSGQQLTLLSALACREGRGHCCVLW